METPPLEMSAAAVMWDWALIWVPFILAPLLLTLGAALAVLWAFRQGEKHVEKGK